MSRYDSGATFDSGLFYDQPEPPTSTRKRMAKPKLNLASLTPEATITLANNIKTAMTGNPNF